MKASRRTRAIMALLSGAIPLQVAGSCGGMSDLLGAIPYTGGGSNDYTTSSASDDYIDFDFDWYYEEPVYDDTVWVEPTYYYDCYEDYYGYVYCE